MDERSVTFRPLSCLRPAKETLLTQGSDTATNLPQVVLPGPGVAGRSHGDSNLSTSLRTERHPPILIPSEGKS